MDKIQLNLEVTPVQLRGCAALVRNLNPVLIERIASESGEAECIFAALDELQCALFFRDFGRPSTDNDSD